MADDTKELTGVEMFAEGTWNGVMFSDDDLDAMVSSFNALNLSGRVPLKLGHEGEDVRDTPETQFALGWVTKLYRQGKMLLADWEVPSQVYSWIKQGLLRHVSVELLKDVPADTRVLPWVLDAVALLGSSQPAVGILKDLKASMARRAVHSSHGGLVTFSRDGVVNFNSSGDSSNMSDTNAIKELTDQLGEFRVKFAKQEADIAALTKIANKGKETETALTSLQEQVQKDKVTAHRALLMARIEAAVKAEDIQPAMREKFSRVYKVTDDDHVLDVTLEDAEAFIKANPNPFKRTVAKSQIVSLARHTDEVPEGTPADQEMALRVTAYCEEVYGADKTPTPDQFAKATAAIFKRNPDLGERYKQSVLVKTGKTAA